MTKTSETMNGLALAVGLTKAADRQWRLSCSIPSRETVEVEVDSDQSKYPITGVVVGTDYGVSAETIWGAKHTIT